jgi:hypothetical protein
LIMSAAGSVGICCEVAWIVDMPCGDTSGSPESE